VDVVRRKSKQILLDILGVLLVFCSLLLLPVPGPGAFPVFIAGMSVLSINHHWARRMLISIRKNGKAVVQKIFTTNPKVMFLIDILGFTFLILGILALFGSSYIKIAGISIIIVGFSMIIYNRQRYKNLNTFKSKD